MNETAPKQNLRVITDKNRDEQVKYGRQQVHKYQGNNPNGKGDTGSPMAIRQLRQHPGW